MNSEAQHDLNEGSATFPEPLTSPATHLEVVPVDDTETVMGEHVLDCEREDGRMEKVRVVEAAPGVEKDIPTMLAPGFTGTPEGFSDLIPTMAEEGGRRVVAVEHPRTSPVDKEIPEGHWQERFAMNHLDRGERLIAAQKAANIEEADLVAHSQGCIDAIVAAYMSLEEGNPKIRNLVLVNPGGVVSTEEQSAKKLVLNGARVGAKMALDALKSPREKGRNFLRNTRDAVKYMASNPRAAIDEVKGIAGTDITECLSYLKGQGINVVILAGGEDVLFPMDQVQKSVKSDMVDGFYSMQGGHTDISQNPEKWGVAIARILDALNARGGKTPPDGESAPATSLAPDNVVELFKLKPELPTATEAQDDYEAAA